MGLWSAVPSRNESTVPHPPPAVYDVVGAFSSNWTIWLSAIAWTLPAFVSPVQCMYVGVSTYSGIHSPVTGSIPAEAGPATRSSADSSVARRENFDMGRTALGLDEDRSGIYSPLQPRIPAPHLDSRPMTQRTLTVGLLGFGTVGTGVVRLLQEHADDIAGRLGASLVIGPVAV